MKIKKITAIFLSFILFISSIPLTLGASAEASIGVWTGAYSSGSLSYSGTEVHIESADDFAYFLYTIYNGNCDYSGKTVYLDLDVDFANNANFKNIWSSYDGDNKKSFKGTFDGQNHTISNVNFSSVSNHRWGIFRQVRSCTIKNLVLSNINMTVSADSSKNGYAALIGYAYSSITLDNITLESGSIEGNNFVGGLVGEIGNDAANTITNCTNKATVTAKYKNAGGIVGYQNCNASITFTNCKNEGNISSNYTSSEGRSGGIAGACKGWVTASDCENSGEIYSAKDCAGGIIGWIEDDETSFTSCTNTGYVHGYSNMGGILGYFGTQSSPKPITFTKNHNTGTIYSTNGQAAGIAASIQTKAKITFIENINNGDATAASGYAGGILALQDGNTNSTSVSFTGDVNTGNISATGSEKRAGGIVGGCYATTTVTQCINSGSVSCANSDCGGIVGWIQDDASSITYCTNTGNVTGWATAGGILGYIGDKDQDKAMTLTGNSNSGTIQATATGSSNGYAGGIAAKLDTDATHQIKNNTNRGNVIATCNVGGIVGYNVGLGVFEECRNYGTISTSSDNAGGICGSIEDDKQTFKNCYNSGNVTAPTAAGGIIGLAAKSIDATDDGQAHSFTNCGNSGDIQSTSSKAGGISAMSVGSSVTYTECWNIGDVKGNNNVGGIIGADQNHINIYRSFNAGSISSYTSDTSNSKGGLAGYPGDHTSSYYTDVYNWGTVTGGKNAGGLIACVRSGSYSRKVKITNAYNAGSVSGGSSTNGIFIGNGTDTNSYNSSYYLSSISGTAQGTSKTDSELKNLASTLGSNYCDNSQRGVTIDDKTYYYPILTWYRDLFTYNVTFILEDDYANINKTVTKKYGNTFTTPTASRDGYTLKWVDTTNSSYEIAENTTVTAGVDNNTQYFTVTQEKSDVENIHADRTYRGVWVPNSLTVNYNGNGSTSGSVSSVTFNYDTEKSASANSFAKTGYTFSGWNTNASGTGTSYAVGSSIKNIISQDSTTLYAMWTANTLTVNYNANGGSGTMSPSSFNYDEIQTAKSNVFTKTGYHFSGWAKTAGGNVEINENGSIKNIVSEGTQNLYAKWAANTYTVNYNANGGSGTTASTSATYDSNITLSENCFTNTSDYVFSGWMTSQNSSNIYKPGSSSLSNLTTENGGSVTLYAKWASLKVDSIALGGDSINAVPNDGWDSREVTSVSVVKDEIETPATVGGEAIEAKYGTVALDNSGKIEYTPTSMTWGNKTDEEIKINITNELNGETYANNSSTVNIYPQTNILFNENSDAEVTLAGDTGTASTDTLTNGWFDVTDTSTASQSTDSTAYGYSDVYGKNAKYSGGSAKRATVTNLTSNASTYSFSFTGTGVDIYSICDKDSGLMIVTLKNHATGERVGSILAINLYYGSADTIYQAPVYHKTGLEYGTYDVEVRVVYSFVFDCTDNAIATANANATDEDFANAFADMGFDPDEVEYYAIADGENLTEDISADVTPTLSGANPVKTSLSECTGDYSVTIDSIRIYNPAGEAEELPDAIADRYSSDGELGAQYLNFRDFITADNYGSCYVVGVGSDASFADYKKNGAKNEVMLNAGADAVSCTVDGFQAGGRVHISLRSPFANPVVADFGNGNTITIGTSTEQYYDITDFVDENGCFTVACSGGILSVCNLKYIPVQNETVVLAPAPQNLSVAAAIIQETAENPAPQTQDVTFSIDFAGKTQDITIPASSFLYEKDGDSWLVTCTLDKATVIELYEKTGLTDDYSLNEGSIKLTATWDGENWIADETKASVNTPEPVTPEETETDDTEEQTDDTQSFISWIKKMFEFILSFFKTIASVFSIEIG